MMLFLNSLFGNKNKSFGKITILDKEVYAAAITSNNIEPVDVRTASEYNNGHLKNAINIDLFNPTKFIDFFEKLERNKAVYVYCRSGSRSQKAARKLLKMGFSQVYDLKGGYMSGIKKSQ